MRADEIPLIMRPLPPAMRRYLGFPKEVVREFCGCTEFTPDWCPLHRAAPRLLWALEAAGPLFNALRGVRNPDLRRALEAWEQQAREAIKEVTG